MYLKKVVILAMALGSMALLSGLPATAETGWFRSSQTQVSASTTSNSSTLSSPHKTVHRRVPVRRRIYRRRRVYRRRASIHRRVRRVVRRRPVLHHARRRVAVYHRVRRRVRYRRARYRRAYYRRVTLRHARYHHYRFWSPWDVRSINTDPSFGDDLAGQNPQIRAAAVKALGHLNGSIVVVDPRNGRILAIVNQRLALTRGYVPCSTVKPMVALAGLKEGVVTLSTRLPGMFGRRVDMTEALAHSDNRYFARVGEMLGFDRVEHYAELLGYGQRASLDIPNESPGVFPSQPPPAQIGGVGRLTSFGTGIEQTPLQMAALVSALANGGTLYWLQWPRTPEEVADFKPEVRRELTGLAPYIPEVREGMAGAVLFGTARLAYNPFEDIFGKTGTCSEDGGRMGWFISFAEQQQPSYVVVVELRGGRMMYGPHAAEVAGNLYRSLLSDRVEAAQAQASPVLLPAPGE